MRAFIIYLYLRLYFSFFFTFLYVNMKPFSPRKKRKIELANKKNHQILILFTFTKRVFFPHYLTILHTYGHLSFDFKVHIFGEGHKILRNLHLNFVLCCASQRYGEISQNFAAFSEYMNLNSTFVKYWWDKELRLQFIVLTSSFCIKTLVGSPIFKVEVNSFFKSWGEWSTYQNTNYTLRVIL